MRGDMVILAGCAVLLATYVACGLWLANKAKKLPLLRDDDQDDQRSQRGRY